MVPKCIKNGINRYFCRIFEKLILLGSRILFRNCPKFSLIFFLSRQEKIILPFPIRIFHSPSKNCMEKNCSAFFSKILSFSFEKLVREKSIRYYSEPISRFLSQKIVHKNFLCYLSVRFFR